MKMPQNKATVKSKPKKKAHHTKSTARTKPINHDTQSSAPIQNHQTICCRNVLMFKPPLVNALFERNSDYTDKYEENMKLALVGCQSVEEIWYREYSDFF